MPRKRYKPEEIVAKLRQVDVPAHAKVILEMADDRLDGGASLEVAFDLLGDPAFLACGIDLELVIRRGIVAAIAGIGDDAVEHIADERLDRRDDLGQGMAVVRVAKQRRNMGDKLATGGMLDRGGDADLDAELIGAMRLALADAFDLGRMQRIDLASALSAVLRQHSLGQIERPQKGVVHPVPF